MLMKLSVPPFGVSVLKSGNPLAMALIAAGLLFPGLVCAEVIPVSSSIGQVTVFSDRALVKRDGQQQVSAGEHELVFKDLPYWLDPRSIQLNAKGRQSVRILDISSRDDFQANSQQERIAELDGQIKQIESQLAQLQDQGKILQNKSNFLEAYQKGSVQQGKDVPRLSTTELLEIMDFSKTVLADTYSAQRELDSKITQLRAELAALQEKRGQIPQDDTVRSKTVVVQLDAPAADKLDLSLSYVVPGASWWPNYDASYDVASNMLKLSYYAQISQQTGEDWNNVKLVLSTAQPMIGAVLPELKPWIVDLRIPRPEMPAPVAMAPLKAMQDRQERAFEPLTGATARVDASFNTATVEKGLSNTVFNIEKPATVPTGPEDKKVAISVSEFKADQTYQLVPALQEAVFLTVKAVNGNDYPLLQGNLNAFLDGQLIASSDIKTVFPGEPIELAMGTDESISVKREPLKRFTESTGLTGSGKRISYEYQTVIQNNRDQTVELVLHDHFPLSRNEKIDIRRISPSDKEIKLKDDGRYEQVIKLAPKEKKTVIQKFSVAYPNEVDVIGLP
ncbi:mucoidy inhibitor MuiA family protein [Advenella sp. RU8]|uniref:mucoidy inhibitor MuiA family protein n=1 Tax=Advenella sp. RU8 TaxID=3399575 RepID=UPI003AAE95FD